MNQLLYDLAVWLDATAWSTAIHESYYLYNWVETTHVLALMVSLGLLFLIDCRMLGLVCANVPAQRFASRLQVPMLLGFGLMVLTGALLFYAVPVRTTQSLWFRIKVVLLIAALVNALLFHRAMGKSRDGWGVKAPLRLRVGAGLSLGLWALVVTCGRLIAYDWFDCVAEPHPFIGALAGCVPGQEWF